MGFFIELNHIINGKESGRNRISISYIFHRSIYTDTFHKTGDFIFLVTCLKLMVFISMAFLVKLGT